MAEEKKKIFILDDDETIVTSLKRLLALSGFEVETTSNPNEALAKIKGFMPQLILLDIRMPHLGGLEICQMLNNDAQARLIPIIIISGLGGYADIKKAYQFGVIDYVTKPYDFKELLKKINKTIASKGDNL